MTSTLIVGFLLTFGTFQIPEVSLSNLEGVTSDSLVTRLPHVNGESEPFALRSSNTTEDAFVRVGAYYRYALDLYQLNKDFYKDRILGNLKELRNELQVVGDQGACRVASRVDETQELEVAIKEDASEESVLKMFSHLNTEIKTLTGESKPNGVNAYDLGNWIAAIGVRSALYSGCTQEETKALILSYVNTLIEIVKKENSDNWNAVVNALPEDFVDSRARSDILMFISGLPYLGILSGSGVDELLTDLNVVFRFFDLRFVV